MITIKQNIDLAKEADKYDVLLVGTNVYNRLANGWQLEAKLLFPLIHKSNVETQYGDVRKLGKMISVPQSNGQEVCLLYITKGHNFRPDLQKDYLEYAALEECLHRVNVFYKGKRIACPILGSSPFDGNGDKERILHMMEETLTDVDVTLYDYVQISGEDKKLELIKGIMDAKTLAKETHDKSLYYQRVREKKEYYKKLKSINNLNYFK